MRNSALSSPKSTSNFRISGTIVTASAEADKAIAPHRMGPEAEAAESSTLTIIFTSQSTDKINHLNKSNTSSRSKIAVLSQN